MLVTVWTHDQSTVSVVPLFTTKDKSSPCPAQPAGVWPGSARWMTWGSHSSAPSAGYSAPCTWTYHSTTTLHPPQTSGMPSLSCRSQFGLLSQITVWQCVGDTIFSVLHCFFNPLISVSPYRRIQLQRLFKGNCMKQCLFKGKTHLADKIQRN